MCCMRVGASRLRTCARIVAAIAMLLMGRDLSQYSASPVMADSPSANVTVFATGLDGPRGLTFGPDGSLYVAEAGRGGTTATVGRCDQVPDPVGPYTNGMTARISKIDTSGNRTTVVDGLPSGISPLPTGDTLGAEDVAFMGTTLYVLLGGGGCSHGVPDVPNTIIKVNADGTWTPLGDLGAFQKANPVAHPQPLDFEPDGTWYSMTVVDGNFYAVEPNHGELDKITPDGQISRVSDISIQGHVVPTSVVYRDGNFYVGILTIFPVPAGAALIYKITPSGDVSVAATGLTAVTGVAFDTDGLLYALEFTTQDNAPPTPGTGKVVRVTKSGALEEIATGLVVPTAMTFGPDSALYVSNFGAAPPGAGQIVRITVPPAS